MSAGLDYSLHRLHVRPSLCRTSASEVAVCDLRRYKSDIYLCSCLCPLSAVSHMRAKVPRRSKDRSSSESGRDASRCEKSGFSNIRILLNICRVIWHLCRIMVKDQQSIRSCPLCSSAYHRSGMARWLERRSLAGGLSRIYALSMAGIV